MYRPALIAWLVLWTLSLAFPAGAQRPNLHHYSSEDGLAQSQILAMAQDSIGFLWFGNYGGLTRYDGAEFEIWTSRDGLPTNTVNRLAASTDGQLALATAGGMLCLLELDAAAAAGSAAPANATPAIDLPGAGKLRCRGLGESVQINDLEFSADGDVLWAASSRGLYGLTEGRLQRFDLADNLPSSRCQTVALDAEWLWVGTDRGLVRRRLEEADGLFESVPFFIGVDVRAVAPSKRGLYVATTDGLALVDSGRVTWAPFAAEAWSEPQDLAVAEGAVAVAVEAGAEGGAAENAAGNGVVEESAVEDGAIQDGALEDGAIEDGATLQAGDAGMSDTFAEDTVWVATHTGLLGWRGQETQQVDARRGLHGDVTNSVIVDREGTIWIGTDFGATKLVPGPFLTYGTAEGAPNPLVRAVEEDSQGRLWIGTRGGVAFFEEGRFTALDLPELRDPRVYSLASSDDGLWIGTRSGLLFWRNGLEAHLTQADGLPSDYVPALLSSVRPETAARASAGQDPPSQGLWIGTDKGLALLRDGELRPVEHPLLERAYVLSMLGDSFGRLWVGLQTGGLRQLKISDDQRVQRVKAFDRAAGLTDLTIWTLDEGIDGELWIGSNGDGAFRIGRDETIESFGSAQGLIDEFVWQVEADSRGGVWFYTNRGLDQLERNGQWHHYGMADGLPDLEGMATAALEDRAGRLWFGTSRGVMRYDPQRHRPNELPPAVRIREVRSQRLGELLPGAVIPPGAGLITARFAALSYREEEAVRFRYRLEGAGEGWSQPIAERKLSFAGLGAGNYRLLVQAANDAGVWSSESAVFSFEIRPHFFHTWLFRLVAGLFLLALVWGAANWRTRKLEKERSRLGKLVTERTLELENKNRHLEEKVDQIARAEMERQHLEERLRQSEKMEAVGRLAGGVAHDFNNLLTTISGFGELLADRLGKDHPQQRDVGEILAAAQRAARLTEQLLAFGRKQLVAPKVLGLNDLVQELANMLERLVGENIELRLDLEAPADTVRCDRGQLEQVLLNLAVNARDAMPGGGRLTLHTRSEALLHHAFGHLGQEIQPGSYVVLEVTDTGQGIEPQVLEHIFEPFFTTKEVGRGTGLGLATVYGIVEQNEGSIDVDSKPGQGSRFIIRLPHVEEQPHPKNVSGSMPLIHVGRQQNTVLVVEDEPTVRRLICGVLRKYGYEVLEAPGAQEAFDLSQGHREDIDLLLTDVVMPDIDGRQVADRLCRERRDLRVLYVSGYPDDFLGARGILPESTHFLNKPFTPKQLIKKVRSVLDEKPV